MRLRAVALLIVLCIYSVRGISFHITPDERKCIREEVHKDVLVVGEYKLSEVPDQRTDLLVSYDTSWFIHKYWKGSCIFQHACHVVYSSLILIGAHFLHMHDIVHVRGLGHSTLYMQFDLLYTFTWLKCERNLGLEFIPAWTTIN